MGIISYPYTEQELNYLNASLDDSSQDVYRQYLCNHACHIHCKLPKGRHSFACRTSVDAQSIVGELSLKGIRAIRSGRYIVFRLTDDKELSFVITSGGSKNIILELRKEIILHNRQIASQTQVVTESVKPVKCEDTKDKTTKESSSEEKIDNNEVSTTVGKERLIPQAIDNYTNLGDDYNRDSFYETVAEYVREDITLDVDLTKSPEDKDVKFLQLMKVMQDKYRHEAKQQKLDMEACEIAIRENELMKY